MQDIDDDGFDDGLEDGGVVDEPVAPPPAPPKNRGGRPRKQHHGVGGANAAAQAPRAPAENDLQTWPKEAELVWAYLLRWLETGAGTNTAHSPSEIRINVTRLNGGMGTGPSMPLPPPFDGDRVSGDDSVSPGEALQKHVADAYHMPLIEGSGRYRIDFSWKQSGMKIKSGEMILPSRAEIIMLRQAQSYTSQRAPLPGMGYAPQPQQYSQPQPQQQQQQGYPPWMQPQAPSMDPVREEVNQLRVQVAQLLGRLSEVIPPNSQQPAYVSPPPAPQQSSEEKIAAAVVSALIGVGAIATGRQPSPPVAAVGVGAPPVVEQSLAAKMEGTIREFAQLKRTFRMADSIFNGDHATEAVAEPMPDEPPAAAEQTSWSQVDVGVKWPDGSNVIHTPPRDKSSWMDFGGFIINNPWFMNKVAERGMGVVENTLKPIAEAVQKGFTGVANGVVNTIPENPGENKAEVVSDIPYDARSANGHGT